jgi:hypothetical protein
VDAQLMLPQPQLRLVERTALPDKPLHFGLGQFDIQNPLGAVDFQFALAQAQFRPLRIVGGQSLLVGLAELFLFDGKPLLFRLHFFQFVNAAFKHFETQE